MSADVKFFDAVIDKISEYASSGGMTLSREQAERALRSNSDVRDAGIALAAEDRGITLDEARLLYNYASAERARQGVDDYFARRATEPTADASPPEPEDPRYLDVFEDHERLDGIIRALSAELSLGYIQSLTWLQDRYDQWCDHRSREECEQVTLSTILGGSAVTLDALTTQVRTLDEQREQELVMLAQDVKTAAPEGEIVQYAGGGNRVKFPPDADPDVLLADPVAARRAYRAAKQFHNPDDPNSRYYDGLWSTFEEFEDEWRLYAEEGFDLAASVQLWRHEAEVKQAKEAAEAAALQAEKAAKANQSTRLQEAARTLSQQAEEARAKATAGQHGVGELTTLNPITRMRLADEL